MRAPSNILRSLPLWRTRPRAPAAVAPLPEESGFGREVAAVLDTLWSQGNSTGEIGLDQFLDAAITTQKIALDSLLKFSHIGESELGVVDLYLENNVEVLDSCNYFVDKIDQIKNYVDSLRTVARVVDVGSSRPNTTARAMELLDSSSCQSVEKRLCKKTMKKHGSCLRKMLRQKLCHETEFSEVLCGSKAMSLMCCKFLELGLSFDSQKLGLPSMKKPQNTSSLWLRLLEELENQAQGSTKMKKNRSFFMMFELNQTVIAAKELKEVMKGKREKDVKFSVERLKISCRKLEDKLVIVEDRVKDLYKCLIHVRMVLLGILSQGQ